ncbi:PREDICTED: uncharacterized protein LOC101370506 [Odobenus rosmarus divergens]|uniref:Uncharacterized protein LOC101370506 n=1 Tax=Odobenus rosmarus divergens TaxID=9708 RepID=A0A2U3VX25_ODORO|nr:PREDICTED: uncharacterized protein LOC101370506 [Odobenus rosmarus divergens]
MDAATPRRRPACRGPDVRWLPPVGGTSLPCHQVPAEEGEGRGAAFPVPLARLDLRGLRLPGNSRAAAGPGSARGLLGAGPERFGTTSPGGHQEHLVLADVKENFLNPS